MSLTAEQAWIFLRHTVHDRKLKVSFSLDSNGAIVCAIYSGNKKIAEATDSQVVAGFEKAMHKSNGEKQ